jgi:hypothetical protein
MTSNALMRMKKTSHFIFLMILIQMFSMSSLVSAHPVTVYPLKNEPLDVLIPCTKKDLETLELCIAGIRKNCSEIRRVIVISSEKITNNAEWFDEAAYPFSKNDIALELCKGDVEKAYDYVNKTKSRIGWYYQQLLKLYAFYVIPDISSNILILDADTVFLKPVKFINKKGGGCYNPSSEYNENYFKHAAKLTGGVVKRLDSRYSGICHHMVFQKPVIDDLFSEVETLHQKEFWRAFCTCVLDEDLERSGAAEYEIYFNFVFSKTDQVEIRFLRWANINRIKDIPIYKKKGFHYVSCHDWSRR